MRMKRTPTVLLASLVLAVISAGQNAKVSAAAAAVPTFSKDVAPILFARCVTCHRPGEVAPMPFLTYAQTRPWAKAIQQKVVKREMPPWHADPRYGKFANDRSLTSQEIDTIVAWAVGGAPQGNVAEMPPPPHFVDGWTPAVAPDYVFEMPQEFPVPAEGQSSVLNFWVPIPFNEDRFAEMIELRPGNRSAVHHITCLVADLPEGGKLTEAGELIFADGTRENDWDARTGIKDRKPGFGTNLRPFITYLPGHSFEPHPPGTGVRISKGKYIRFDVHYQATGRPETDRSRLALWFSKASNSEIQELYQSHAGMQIGTSIDTMSFHRAEGIQRDDDRERNARGDGQKFPNIPPYAKDYKIVSVSPIPEPITVYGFWPHQHLRGKSTTWTLTRPDGRQEILLSIPQYDFNWQIQYDLAEPLHIPAGSTITAVGLWDNSAQNKYNPAPDQEVYWSEQSWNEMWSAFYVYTVDSQKSSKSTQGKSR